MVSKVFNPNATFMYLGAERRAVQDLCLNDQYKVAKIIEFALERFGQDVQKLAIGKFALGPTKDRGVAEGKIIGELGGVETLLTDVVRCKHEVNSVGAIFGLRELFDPDGAAHPIMEEHGVMLVAMHDHFAEPKFETGYRCINAKPKFSLSKAIEHIQSVDPKDVPQEVLDAVNDLDPELLEAITEFDEGLKGQDFFGQIIEFQVVHEAFEAVYDETHGHMRAAQKISMEYPNQRIPNDEAIKQARHNGVCQLMNGRAARAAKLDVLLDSPEYAMNPEKDDNLHRFLTKNYEGM